MGRGTSVGGLSFHPSAPGKRRAAAPHPGAGCQPLSRTGSLMGRGSPVRGGSLVTARTDLVKRTCLWLLPVLDSPKTPSQPPLHRLTWWRGHRGTRSMSPRGTPSQAGCAANLPPRKRLFHPAICRWWDLSPAPSRRPQHVMGDICEPQGGAPSSVSPAPVSVGSITRS